MATGVTSKARALFSRQPETHGAFAMTQPQLTQIFSAPLRTVDDGVDRGSITDDAWQREAFRLNSEVGEIGYVQDLSANILAQGELVLEEWKDGRWHPSTDKSGQRVLAAFVDARGSDHDLKRRAGLHLGIAGESWLVGSPAKTPRGVDTGIVWEFLSGEELIMHHGDGAVTRRRDGTGSEELGKNVYIARLWNSDPQFSMRADSPMRRSLNIAREVLKLTQLVSAVADSRLNAGLFFVPMEMTFASEDDEDTDGDPDSFGDEEDPNAGIDKFIKRFIRQLKAPKENPASPATLIPLIMRGPGMIGDRPTKDLMGLVSLERDLDTWAMELRQEALHRLAVSLDVPVEVMEGKGGLNHWTGFNVDGDLIARHVAPKGFLLANFLTVAYLRPMLEVFEGLSAAVSTKFRIRYDISALKSALDEATFTRFAYDRGEASGVALRRSHGVDESDAPTDEERERREALELIKAVPILAAVLLPKVFPGLDITPLLQADEADADKVTGSQRWNLPEGRKTDPSSARSLGPGTSKQSGNDMPGPRGRTTMGFLVERLASSADAALERAFERAGSQLSSVACNQKDLTLRDRIKGAGAVRATSLVSSAELQSLGLTPDKILNGAWDSFSFRARGWVRDYLEAEGADALRADDQAALAVSEICTALDQYARSFLHLGLQVGGNGLRCPDELIVTALSTVTLVAV